MKIAHHADIGVVLQIVTNLVNDHDHEIVIVTDRVVTHAHENDQPAEIVGSGDDL